MKINGFTIVEMLLVITLVAILFSLLIPVISYSYELVRDIKCKTTLRNIQSAYSSYAIENNGLTIHGVDNSFANWPNTNLDKPYYYTDLYKINNEDIAIGQLFSGCYLPYIQSSIICEQTDYRTYEYASGGTYVFNKKDIVLNFSVKNINSKCGSSYCYRGPIYKIDTLNSSNAIFSEQEIVLQSVISSVPFNGSPVPYGYGKIHRYGYNVSFVDASVGIFKDEDRSNIYWSNQCRFYGSMEPLFKGYFDR